MGTLLRSISAGSSAWNLEAAAGLPPDRLSRESRCLELRASLPFSKTVRRHSLLIIFQVRGDHEISCAPNRAYELVTRLFWASSVWPSDHGPKPTGDACDSSASVRESRPNRSGEGGHESQ